MRSGGRVEITAVRIDDEDIRALLVSMVDGAGAHARFDDAVADFPAFAINRRPLMAPYTPWQLLEHIRRAQRDILDYLLDPHQPEPAWPRDYWPSPGAIGGSAAMAVTIARFRADREALREVVLDHSRDPFAPIPGTRGHNLAREIRLVADHNAYHIGEFAILRAVMNTWPKLPEE